MELATLAVAALAVELATLAVATLAVELATLAVATLLESGLHSLLLFIAELAVLVGIELVHELGFEVLTHGLLLIVVDPAVLVSVEPGHELGLASLHESLTILLGSGLRGGGGDNCGSGSLSGSLLGLLSENRQSGYDGDDDGFLHNLVCCLRVLSLAGYLHVGERSSRLKIYRKNENIFCKRH